ncbi:TF211 protein, partial [Donacobius atricapilla]|nr:TF211 protein [Donacobius atricapilla]
LHASTHWGTQDLCDHFMQTYVCIGIFEIAKMVTRDCMICQRINRKVMRKASLGGRELAQKPFQNVQVDFTELPPVQRFRYLLVVIDHLTHWVKAFPTIRATAGVVSNILLQQIPRYGIVNIIDSDRGPHFTAKVLHQVAEALGITWRLHTPWRPQSSGRVERMNQTLKETFTKLVEETTMNWLKCLPLALMRIRMKPRADTGISPYETMFGLPFLTISGCVGTWEEGEQVTKKYIQIITNTLEELRKNGYLPQRTQIDFKIHSFQLGNMVLIKVW